MSTVLLYFLMVGINSNMQPFMNDEIFIKIFDQNQFSNSLNRRSKSVKSGFPKLTGRQQSRTLLTRASLASHYAE